MSKRSAKIFSDETAGPAFFNATKEREKKYRA